MTKDSDNIVEPTWKKSGISVKFPTCRNLYTKVTVTRWLRGKRADDEAEGLWRIHDKLYDLTPFVRKHPGGSFWLQETKGTDITEHFETHHIRGVPEALLNTFYVRNAAEPRNYKFTLKENGFYKTLKRRVAAKVQDLDYGPEKRTYFYHLGLLISTVLLFVMATHIKSYIIEVMAALSLAWLANSAHNFFHRRDNWQMYTFNLSLMNFNDWRVSHVLSHHHYTNSLHDLEMSLYEPFIFWVPNKYIAGKTTRMFLMLLQPVFYYFLVPFSFTHRFFSSIIRNNLLYWDDLIGFSMPLLMMYFSPSSPMEVIVQWLRIIGIFSFIFNIIGLNAAHHTPDIFHDGDAVREDRDWGLYQLDAIIDRNDIKESHFMSLTHYGNHVLHHMFPTLDHGVLPQLYPIFLETLKEFQEEFREISFLQHMIGQQKQILRTQPNAVARNSKRA